MIQFPLSFADRNQQNVLSSSTVSAQGADERMINVHYYYYYCLSLADESYDFTKVFAMDIVIKCIRERTNERTNGLLN